MTVVDDLTLLAKLLPPSLSSRYRVQVLWSVDVNKDIGFCFTLHKELANEKREDGDHQLRDFNLANINQSSAAATRGVGNVEESIFTPESQEPNPGRLDTEMKDPEIMVGSGGDPQGFIVRGRRNEKMKCDKCGWEGTRKAYGPHVKSIHGTKPKLTRCEKCGIKCYSLWLVSHKCSQQWPDGHQRKGSKGDERKTPRHGGKTCGTCGFRTSDLRSHVLLKHSNKEQYLEQHYNQTNTDQELKRGYNCHICGKYFLNKSPLWKHVASMHGVVTIEDIRKVAMGKSEVEDKSVKKDQRLTELESVYSVESNVLKSTSAAVVEEEHHSGDENKTEEKEVCSNAEGKRLNLTEEKKTELDSDENGKMSRFKRKRERKALREVSPSCDYERIRAANIAERMELLRTLDIEGAVASVKERLS